MDPQALNPSSAADMLRRGDLSLMGVERFRVLGLGVSGLGVWGLGLGFRV